MRHRLLLSLPAIALAATALAGCAAAEPSAGPTPSPTHRSHHATPTASPTGAAAPVEPSRVGQPAGAGGFDPLAVPAGMPFGPGHTPSTFTPAGTHLETGQVATIDGRQCTMPAAAPLLISVDTVTDPITGPARDQALTALGYAAGTRQIVQEITLRVRQIGGVDVGTAWMLSTAVQVLNYAHHEPMPLYSPAGDTPLDLHGVSTGDTVQVILYAAGTPDEYTTTPLEQVQLFNGCRDDGAVVAVNSPHLAALACGDE